MDENKLDVSIFSDELKSVSIGKLDDNMIRFILEREPNFSGQLSSDTNIIFWSDRVRHTERHREDFVSSEEYDECLEDIPKIIQSPDYISIPPDRDTLCFIKKYTKHVIVVIKVSIKKSMSYRTMYPLKDSQLKRYIENNSAWEYKEST